MPGLAYSRPTPEKVASGIEALLRKELGSPSPLPYQILPGEGEGATAKSALADMGKALTMTKQQSVVLFYVHFALDLPRPFELRVSVTRYGLIAVVGKCAYTVPLNRSIQGAVSLGATRLGPANSFTGDATTIARLNSNRDLIAQARKLAVAKTTIGRLKLTIPQRLDITPSQSGSLLTLHRLGVPGFLGGANLGAKDLFAFVPQLETSLS